MASRLGIKQIGPLESGSTKYNKIPTIQIHIKLFLFSESVIHKSQLSITLKSQFSAYSTSGLQAPILSAIKPPSSEPMSKVKLVKYLMWDEKSIRERKHRDRGSAINQMERMIIVTSEEMGWSFHNRVHYAGTNRGDVIAPIKAPSWDEPWLFEISMNSTI